jgi:hypothetical protein
MQSDAVFSTNRALTVHSKATLFWSLLEGFNGACRKWMLPILWTASLVELWYVFAHPLSA